jgi:hypothetical protein
MLEPVIITLPEDHLVTLTEASDLLFSGLISVTEAVFRVHPLGYHIEGVYVSESRMTFNRSHKIGVHDVMDRVVLTKVQDNFVITAERHDNDFVFGGF